MTRLLHSLAAIAALAGILIGAPWLLLQLGRWPGFLPALDHLPGMLLAPDSGRFLLLLIWAAAWALWAWLTTLILIELVALLRGVKAPRMPAASLPQGLARALVVTAAAAFVAAPLTAGATPQASAPEAAPHAVAAPSQAVVQAPRPDAAPTTVEAETVTVEAGDTLWGIAEEHLDNPERWPEVFELNEGIPQPTGHALTDPDQIDIGWTLTLPPDTPLVEAPATAAQVDEPTVRETAGEEVAVTLLPAEDSTDTVAPAVPSPAATSTAVAVPTAPARATNDTTPQTASSSPTPSPRRAEIAADSEVSEDELDAEAGFPWQVAGLLGAGSFLGVGIAAALAARRRDQFRTRRPGHLIATPDPVVAPIEMTAQLATGLSARLVTRLHAILCRLDPATGLQTAVVARDGTISLHTTSTLPSPWVRDGDGWLLPTTVPVDALGEQDDADSPCPFPLLVTIGADTRNRVVLLNLEHEGVLTIAGDPLMSADFARYLAAELAVNPWSDQVRISCHGPAAQVIPMAPDRLDATPHEILNIATTNTTRTTDSDITATVGRAGQVGDETWAAAALITDQDDEGIAELAAAITTHPGRTGVALILHTDDPGTLTLTSSGRIRGLGYELTAVGLTEDEAAGCADLLAAADHGNNPAPAPADDLVDVTGNLLPGHRVDRDDTTGGAVDAILPAPDEDYVAAAVVTPADLQVLAPRVPDTVAEALTERDPDLDAQVRAWFSPTCPYPRLTLLGPVQARCYGKPVAKRKAYYTEALAYLALHPQGVTSEQVADAFGLSIPRARTVISDLRLWVGTNPATGGPHIPDAKASAQAQARGVGLYLVEDLLVDADLFRRLRARGLARGAAGIADLEAALQLVTGRPFDQLRPNGWTWLIDGDRHDHHMICAVADVAHLLVTHHLHTGDLEAAKRAATISLQADPTSETARLNLAGIMIHQGHSTSARQIVADALGDHVDLDLTDRATEILTGKDWLRTG